METAISSGLKKNFFFFNLAALGLHCCVPAFPRCGDGCHSLAVGLGLLIAVASLVPEHSL